MAFGQALAALRALVSFWGTKCLLLPMKCISRDECALPSGSEHFTSQHFHFFRDVPAHKMGRTVSPKVPRVSGGQMKIHVRVLSIPGEVGRKQSIKLPYFWGTIAVKT